MDWKDLGGTLIGAGLPILGRMIGGSLLPLGGGEVGAAIGTKIANALGVEAKPEAVSKAIAGAEDPAVTVQRLKNIETEAAVRWPALAEMAKAQAEADTRQFEASLKDVQDARARDVAVRAQNNGTNLRSNLLIAGAFSTLFTIIVFVFMKIQNLSEPGSIAVLTFLSTLGGQITGWIASVFTFEFGATRQGGDRSNQLADMAQKVISTNAVPAILGGPPVTSKK